MRDLLQAAAAVIATRRAVDLITEDEITRPIREKIWESHPIDSSKLGYVISCRKCSSVWAGLAIAGLYHLGSPGRLLANTLALSGAALLVDAAAKKYLEDPSEGFFN